MVYLNGTGFTIVGITARKFVGTGIAVLDLFVLCISLLASFLFGLTPALANPDISLVSSGRSGTSGVRTRRL